MNATLRIPILSEKQLKYLQGARSELTNAGVIFDTGYDLKEGIFDWELDWSLKSAKLNEKSELVFESKIETIKYIKNAENKLKQAGVYFNTGFSANKEKVVWDLNEIRGAELVIRKTRKEPTKGVKRVRPKLKLPLNLYKKGETE